MVYGHDGDCLEELEVANEALRTELREAHELGTTVTQLDKNPEETTR